MNEQEKHAVSQEERKEKGHRTGLSGTLRPERRTQRTFLPAEQEHERMLPEADAGQAQFIRINQRFLFGCVLRR